MRTGIRRRRRRRRSGRAEGEGQRPGAERERPAAAETGPEDGLRQQRLWRQKGPEEEEKEEVVGGERIAASGSRESVVEWDGVGADDSTAIRLGRASATVGARTWRAGEGARAVRAAGEAREMKCDKEGEQAGGEDDSSRGRWTAKSRADIPGTETKRDVERWGFQEGEARKA